MDDVSSRVRAAFEAHLGRKIEEAEVTEIVSWFRQLAGLVAEWSHDEGLASRLSLTSQQREQLHNQRAPSTTQGSLNHVGQRSK
jgi:hypothetical protein